MSLKHTLRVSADLVAARDLVLALDRTYPHECIRPGEKLEEAHRRAGKRELVDELLGIYGLRDHPDRRTPRT